VIAKAKLQSASLIKFLAQLFDFVARRERIGEIIELSENENLASQAPEQFLTVR
jgi:hypothetical protein